MDIPEIIQVIRQYKQENKKLFTTTSLQTHSLVLLHILKQADADIDIYFINTGYHFSETIRFKEEVSERLNIKINVLNSPVSKHLQKDSKGNLLFTTDPDLCCYYNKTLPVKELLYKYDVWINGIRSVQNEARKKLNIHEHSANETIRFHPILDWTDAMITEYITKHNLPKHPLESKGYTSIGCEPCTRKTMSENIRDSRWFGLNKTECGLNTDLIEKQ